MEEKQQTQFNKMTEEPVGNLLLKLSIPTILSMMVTNFYSIVDTAFVGKLGTSQSGATGVVFGYMAILQAVAFMCGQGGGSIMSRKLGAKQLDEANKYSTTSFLLSFSLGALIGLLSILFMNPLLKMLGSTETIAPYAKTYLYCIIAVAPFFTSSYTMNNLLRYEGKAKLGTIGMMTGAVLNMGLDPILMFVFDMGILGAGLSTAISQMVSFIILFSMYLRNKTQTKLNLKFFSGRFETYYNIVTTGFPSLLRQSLNSISTMLLNKYAGVYGDAAVSAMSSVSRISFFPTSICLGVGQGFQPISAFNYGAKRKDRVKKAFWTASAAGEVVALLSAIPIFILSPNLVRLLRDDAEVIEIGARALRLMCICQFFVPYTMMIEMGFQSIGYKLYASIGSSLRSGLVFIPVLVLFSHMRGLAGIQEAQPVAFVISFFISALLGRAYLKVLKDNSPEDAIERFLGIITEHYAGAFP
ncbi:MAG: MATE family efflux transporter, partial [Lachnospiraceae bacterium]|nr:MATE family efflux transporter [Lachnospiraceae bacterium]